MNKRNLWEFYEKWFFDRYQKFMYFTIVLDVPSNVLLALKHVWIDGYSLFFVLKEELFQNKWKLQESRNNFHRYTKNIEDGQKEVIMSISNETNWRFDLYRYERDAANTLRLSNRTFHYVWLDINIGLSYSFETIDSKTKNVADGITLAELARGIINLIEQYFT